MTSEDNSTFFTLHIYPLIQNTVVSDPFSLTLRAHVCTVVFFKEAASVIITDQTSGTVSTGHERIKLPRKLQHLDPACLWAGKGPFSAWRRRQDLLSHCRISIVFCFSFPQPVSAPPSPPSIYGSQGNLRNDCNLQGLTPINWFHWWGRCQGSFNYWHKNAFSPIRMFLCTGYTGKCH